MKTCPNNGRSRRESANARKDRSDVRGRADFVNRLAKDMAETMEGILSEDEIKKEIHEILAKRDFLKKYNLEGFYGIPRTHEQDIRDAVEGMIRTKHMMGSENKGEYTTKQSARLFSRIFSSFRVTTKAGRRQHIADMIGKLNEQKIELKSNILDSMRVVKNGKIIKSAREVFEEGRPDEVFKAFTDAMFSKTSASATKGAESDAVISARKLGMKYKNHIKQYYSKATDTQIRFKMMSDTFDMHNIINLGPERTGTMKYYDFLLGKDRLKMTEAEHKMAKNNFIDRYRTTFDKLDDDEIGTMFDLLTNRKKASEIEGFRTSVKNEQPRSVFQDIDDIYGDRITKKQLSQLHGENVKRPGDLMDSIVDDIVDNKVRVDNLGPDVGETFKNIRNMAKKNMQGAELDEFLDSVSLLEDAMVKSTNKETEGIKFLSNSVFKNSWKEGVYPLASLMLLKATGMRHLLEATSSGLKYQSLTGEFNLKTHGNHFVDAVRNAEGMMVRETLRSLSTLPGFRDYASKIEKLAELLDFSGMRKIPLEEQIKLLEDIGISLGDVKSFAGVISTPTGFKEGGYIMHGASNVEGGIAGWAQRRAMNTSWIGQMDHFASVLSMRRTNDLMEQMISNPEKWFKNAVLAKKAEEIGLTKDDVYLLKELLDGQDVRWADFVKSDFDRPEIQEILDKMMIAKSPKDFDPEIITQIKEDRIKDELTKLSGELLMAEEGTGQKKAILRKISKLKEDNNRAHVTIDEYNKIMSKVREENPERLKADRIKVANQSLRRAQDLEQHIHTYLTSPKPDPLWSVGLSGLNKHADSLGEANFIIKNKVMFLSTGVSVMGQMKETVGNIATHYANSPDGKAKAKLISGLGSHMAMLVVATGVINTIKNDLTGSKNSGVLKNGAKDDIIFAGVGTYIENAEGVSGFLAQQFKNALDVINAVFGDDQLARDQIAEVASGHLRIGGNDE